jgi:hypothetical protein
MKEAEHRVAFWRNHWKAWAESGTSQRVYCARAGVTYATFRYWRKRANMEPRSLSDFLCEATTLGQPRPEEWP